VPALLLATGVPFAIGYLVTTQVLFPPREVAAAGIPTPQLTGLTALEAERVLAQAGLGRLEPLELPHPSVQAGRILAQSPLPEQQLRPGSNVRVSLSSGSVRVRIPDVAGQPAERAEQLLRRLGFTVDRVESESPVPRGRVHAVVPASGTVIPLPAHLTLHVSLGPPALDTMLVDSSLADPPATLPDTLPPIR
jgi:serine/threonine-protein kinase